MLCHTAHGSLAAHALLSFTFALLTAAFVKGCVQLSQRKTWRVVSIEFQVEWLLIFRRPVNYFVKEILSVSPFFKLQNLILSKFNSL